MDTTVETKKDAVQKKKKTFKKKKDELALLTIKSSNAVKANNK